jgi:peptidylprolyl isomerase
MALALTACGNHHMPVREVRDAPQMLTMPQVLEQSAPDEWRSLDLANTLYLEFEQGRVIIELYPWLAPKHVANILRLTRAGYFDQLNIIRVQDNFVVQWGDGEKAKQFTQSLPGEFEQPLPKDAPIIYLPDVDGYASHVGFRDSMPIAADPEAGLYWGAHCYGVLGAGRDNSKDSGSGAELYVVTGHAPRQLDRNITVAGRVIQGMPILSAFTRGEAPMGMLPEQAAKPQILKVRVAADVPEAERTALEILRSDSASFVRLVESRRNRPDAWYLRKAGHIDLCNVPLPTRPKTTP